jgi:hypothetical protein
MEIPRDAAPLLVLQIHETRGKRLQLALGVLQLSLGPHLGGDIRRDPLTAGKTPILGKISTKRAAQPNRGGSDFPDNMGERG